MFLLGCTTALERPEGGRCARQPLAPALASANGWLRLVPYAPQRPYDIGARGEAIALALRPVPDGALAVLSYPEPRKHAGGDDAFHRLYHRSFTYDNALAILWLVADGRLAEARQIAQTLAVVQRDDGAWGFGFATHGDGFINAGYVRTGTVAFVAYALARYQLASGDRSFAGQLRDAMRWLIAQRRHSAGLLVAGQGRWLSGERFEPDWRAEFAATEHQIDAWFAFAAMQRAEPAWSADHDVRGHQLALADAIRRVLWLPDERRFAQGARADYGVDHGSALDAAGTWGALWWLAQGDPARAQEALRWAEVTHAVRPHGWEGLRPYLTEPPETWFVEGSVAAALVHARLGQRDKAAAQLGQLAELACVGGPGLVYAVDWADDFPLSPAAGPTLWFLLAGREFLEPSRAGLWDETATGELLRSPATDAR